MEKGVLVLGATSPIARAAAEELAKKGYSLFLASRDREELDRIAKDLEIRYGMKADYGVYDIDNPEENLPFLNKVLRSIPVLEGVVFAIGYLGDQMGAVRNPGEVEKIFFRNFNGACAILELLAGYFEQRRSGFIVGVSSVAGDRGRQSNYLYGAAKGGFSIFLQGLRNRLHFFGVRVLTVKPGFVDTSMTFGKDGMFCVATPQSVGKAIVKAVEKGKDVVYLPWFWRYIMGIIKVIPETFFKRLRL